MRKLASTLWASALLGVAFTSSALAQTAPGQTTPDPDVDVDADVDADADPAPMDTDEPTTIPSQPMPQDPDAIPASPPVDVNVDVNTPPPPPPQTNYVVAPTPINTNIEEEEEGPLSRFGVAIAAGGGAGGFTNEALRDSAGVGGDWDVRLTLGTRSPIAFEGSYIGSAQAIDALGLDDDAVLVGNGVQGALRLNATIDGPVQPFLYAGAAWRRYDLQADTNLSDVRGEDDVLEIPVGIGIAGRYRGLILDARGEFRGVTGEDLLPEVNDTTELGDPDNFAEMHRWGAKATVGFEF